MRTSELARKFNSNIKKLLTADEYNVFSRKSISLLNSKRLDIIAKYIYVKAFISGRNKYFALNLYLEHIRVFNGFVENDDSNKIGQDAFLNSFNELIKAIQSQGYMDDSIIPLGIDNTVLDGGHRVATAIYFNFDVPTIRLDFSDDNFRFDFEYFKNKGLAIEYLDSMALEYARLRSESAYVVLVWPSAKGRNKELENVLNRNGSIVYRKDINISRNGMYNLMRIAYRNEPWLGTYSDDFSGGKTKADLCYQPNSVLRAFLFESDADLIKMKDEIRNLFGIEKHAVHINDDQNETIELSETLFNNNGIHFLNAAHRKHIAKFDQLFSEFKSWVQGSRLDLNEFCLAGGSLAAYGIKESSDIDFVTTVDSLPYIANKDIEEEVEKLKYINLPLDSLIHDPRNYFFFRGVKFLSLDVIQRIKKQRLRDSDRLDLLVIDELLKNGKYKESFSTLLKRLLKISFYKRLIKLLLLRIRYYMKLAMSKKSKKGR